MIVRVCPKNGLSCAHCFFTSIPPWLVGPTPRQRMGVFNEVSGPFQVAASLSMPRRFKPPWTAERMSGGYVVKDATLAPRAEEARHNPHKGILSCYDRRLSRSG